MIRYLRQNDGLLLVLIPSLFVIGSLSLAWLSPHIHAADLNIPLLRIWFPNWDFHLSPWVAWLINVPLVVVAMILLNRAVQQLSLLGKLSNIPLLGLALMYFILPQSAGNPANWISAIFCVLVLQEAAGVLFENQPSKSLFNAGFIIGLMTLFSAANMYLLFALWAVLLIGGSMTIKRLVLSLVAIGLPLYFAWVLAFVFETGGHSAIVQVIPNQVMLMENLQHVPTLVLTLLLAAVSLIAHLDTRRATTLRERKKWQFELSLIFCVGMAVAFHDPQAVAVIASVPSAIVLSRVMAVTPKKWLASLVLYGCLVSAIINQWSAYL